MYLKFNSKRKQKGFSVENKERERIEQKIEALGNGWDTVIGRVVASKTRNLAKNPVIGNIQNLFLATRFNNLTIERKSPIIAVVSCNLLLCSIPPFW